MRSPARRREHGRQRARRGDCPSGPSEGRRILAVDDQEDALGLLRVILESAGADVTTAASARHALEFLQNGTYDALISDIGMPQMDGLG